MLVDTAYFIALLDPRDRWHNPALQLTRQLEDTKTFLVTTDAVLLELANYFSRSPLRSEAILWIGALRRASGWDVAPLDGPLVRRGESRYRAHGDKTWSLTDCISMDLMEQRGLERVATTDHHFEQAGFSILMK